MAQQTATRNQAPKKSRSIVPFVCLAVAIVSVVASLVLWKHQRDNYHGAGTRVIAGSQHSQASADLAITALSAPQIWHCAKGSDNTVLLSWATTGATSVSIVVGDAARPAITDQAPSSQYSVPAPCAPDSQTYTVIAKSADGKQVTKSATTKGV